MAKIKNRELAFLVTQDRKSVGFVFAKDKHQARLVAKQVCERYCIHGRGVPLLMKMKGGK